MFSIVPDFCTTTSLYDLAGMLQALLALLVANLEYPRQIDVSPYTRIGVYTSCHTHDQITHVRQESYSGVCSCSIGSSGSSLEDNASAAEICDDLPIVLARWVRYNSHQYRSWREA
jgi:hypothetical protein